MSATANFDFISREMEFQDDQMVLFVERECGKDKSSDTVKEYARGLEQYSTWLGENDLDSNEVDFLAIERYLSYMTNQRGFADKTTKNRLIPVRGYYELLAKRGVIESNPVDNVDTSEYYQGSKTRKGEELRQQREFLTADEVKELAENVPDPQIRNRLLVMFTYYTGLRRREVVNVKLEDVDIEARTVEVEVKNSKSHTATYHEKLDSLMNEWLKYGRRDAYATAEESDYLFLTNRSERMSPVRFGEIVQAAAENAGLQETLYTDAAGNEQKKISVHTLRHSFAMRLLNSGAPIEVVKNRLAHESLKTTEIYGEIQDDKGIEEYHEHMDGIDLDDIDSED
jgi:integrase/recombinase XerD